MAFTTFSISSKLTPLKKYVHSENGMLVFNDEQSFTTVVDCLYACIQSLENKNLNIDIDEYDYVLEQFENVMGHKSLRQYVARKVNGLLAIDELTDENDPDECFFPDPVLRSLVNTEFELRIGGKIVSLRNVQNDYLAIKKDDNYVSPFVSFKTEQQTESALGSNCKTTGTSNGITITDFWLTPKIGFANVVSVRAKLEGDCDTNTIFTINFEITDSNGNLVEPPFSETVSDVFASVLRYDRTYLGFQKAGKYKICVWIEREGMNCKSANVCCEFDVKETKEQKPDCCKPIGKSFAEFEFGPGKSLQMRSRLIVINTFVLPYSSVNAQTKHYRKVRNKFRPRKADDITVNLFGVYNELYCNGPSKQIIPGVKAKGKSRQVTIVKYTGVLIFIRKDSISSVHTVTGFSQGDTRKIVSC